jgi:hypothetical protein
VEIRIIIFIVGEVWRSLQLNFVSGGGVENVLSIYFGRALGLKMGSIGIFSDELILNLGLTI